MRMSQILHRGALLSTTALMGVAPGSALAQWAGEYKLSATDQASLTEADVVGPDGLVYPDWRHAGVPGGIPEIVGAGAIVDVSDFGAIADDGVDDAQAVSRAAEALLDAGGGVLRFGRGVYQFGATLRFSDHGNVIIRGAGMDETILEILPSIEPNDRGFIYFSGGYSDGTSARAAADIPRGSREVLLESEVNWPAGKIVRVDASADAGDPSFREERYQSGHTPPIPRMVMLQVKRSEGKRVTFTQPIRWTLPQRHDVRLTGMNPVMNTGVEDLTIRQPQPLAREGRLMGVMWYSAARGWMKNVKVLDIETSPFGTWIAKWIEVRDCVFDGARHNTSGGGNGYAGFSDAADCLMDNVVARRLRHAPTFNGSVGCVARNVRSEGAAASFHQKFCTENLIENCVLDTRGNPGGYETAISVSRWHGRIHGPEGPRNVIWGNDVISPDRQDGNVWKASALHLGGRLEGWIVAYNYFRVMPGDGVVFEEASFDNIFRQNVFVLQESGRVGFRALGDGCVGNELVENVVQGSSAELFTGFNPASLQDNKVLRLGIAVDAPEPPVPSIFLWQRRSTGQDE